MVETKPCACPCGRIIVRKNTVSNWNWKRQRYFDPVLCKRIVRVMVAKDLRTETRIAKENFQNGLVDTNEFWQIWLCGRL